MGSTASARVAVVVARTIDHFIDRFDPSQLDESRRIEALDQIASVRAALPASSILINASFAKLERVLRRPLGSATQPSPVAGRKLVRVLRALAPLAMVGASLSTFVATPAMAALLVYNVGDSITNPATGNVETVTQLVETYGVVTSNGNFILLAQTVGDTYTVTDNSTSPATVTTYEVTATTLTSGRVTSVTVKNLTTNATSTVSTTTTYSGPPPIGGGTGSGVTYATPSFPGSPYIDIRAGGDGGDGRDGGGVCFGELGCIQYAPGNGGAGGNGPNITDVVDVSWGAITTTADQSAGIVVVSKGGDGGDGGTGYGNIPPARGGDAGNGGTVVATNKTTVETFGVDSYGMLVQSVGGRAGAGGNCYVACSGGGPGVPGNGGSATGINENRITTWGNGASGLVVQSSGGNAGTGGSSYGLYGDAGSGGYGGNGGNVHAVNNGSIRTYGDLAYGVLAQSIGGIGGNSGSSGGLVAFSGSGGGGGKGGDVQVDLGANSITKTSGVSSHAVLAQSLGGGGGATGTTDGAFSFGSAAGDGGSAGTVTVNAAAGAFIGTEGVGANGIYAESVGGTGGTAGGTGGVFTMGGSGGTGKTGGNVTVTSSATIETLSQDGRGIFAQSVGGGGGSANTSGGVISLGGSGGTGANGGNVSIALGAASNITTYGMGADGAFAQSIGGGGGSGGSSMGLVALGGTGSVGGSAGVVSVTNAGTITTVSGLSRGIFAQSVGGGGGTGGNGDGLVSIGGAGSAGGDGGAVTLGNSGLIRTESAYSQGIFGQSIGGGGGSGGDAGGLAAIGGSGSSGGLGGSVTVTNTGQVMTGGNMSAAVLVQSIGGGGGIGGSTGGVLLTIGGSGGAGSNAGTVTANISGSLQTTGDDSDGLIAQAVGGGGGSGGSSTSVSAFAGVALGGSGSGGGSGGTVNVNLNSQTVMIGGVPTDILPFVSTTGDRSRGIFAQSVGGGGGSGGYSVQTSVGAFGAASVSIGGSGGEGSQGGAASINGDAFVMTTGDNSQGIFVQSVGGGGGAGGLSVAAALSGGVGFSGSLALSLGGMGGYGGYGGTVAGTSGGRIITTGMFSTGYLAQSLGGGGGAGGFSVSVTGAASNGFTVSGSIGAGGSGGGGGDGGVVNATFNGAISTGGADGSGSNANGFVAQSVGGGGGAGGFNVSAALGFSGGGSIGGAIGLGGSGAGGGVGGTVTGQVGTVTTTGNQSTAVLIQSVGGGGGSGGFNVSGTLTGSGVFAGGIAVGLGGSGAGGGNGGQVTGTVTGMTKTSGNQSDGVFIQSLGGGGGSGGFNVAGNIAVGGSVGPSAGVSVGLGGSGGVGGLGSSATGYVRDYVETTGNQSRGVLVQSAGGGGGGGGFNVTGNLSISGTGSAAVGVGLGGSGGAGGAGGTVWAEARDISTAGNDSGGFIAQSLGGGGGAGGFNIDNNVSFSGGAGGSIGVGLGGSGGGGGNAGDVTAIVIGNTITKGNHSGAILAQSVGGGGGAGGFNIGGSIAASNAGSVAVSVGLGGSGGTAGNAGNVSLTVVGAAQTGSGTGTQDRGSFSDGIVAQSLGGGGGTGGFNVDGSIAASATGGAGQVGIGIGGHGGGGGSAGAVSLKVNDGVLINDPALIASITLRDYSSGIVAQSIGGGGGSGGFSVGAGISVGQTGAGGVNVGIGGSGGDGNGANAVFADISGLTQTYGFESVGVLAQSVGGGGGSGGFNVRGGISIGVAGAGGINVGVGGSGGKGASAGAVDLKINDQIVSPTIDLTAVITSGDRSAGIVAQSLGGGGGNGGFNVTGGINASQGSAGGVNIGIGGKGGSGSSAQAASADITGKIITNGDESDALVVQSIGGGGGNGGFNVTGGINVSGGAQLQIGVGIGGFGGDGGSAGAVSLLLNKRINDSGNTLVAAATYGEDSDGIIVQSLGGGGGNGGFNVTGSLGLSMGGAGTLGVGIGGFGGTGGASGSATADIIGDIFTAGYKSDGLLVQSAGGGGGNGGFNVTAGATIAKAASGNIGVGIGGFGGNGGAGADVKLTLVGDITTMEHESKGATVQSLGGGGGNGGFNVTGLLSVSGTDQPSGNIGVGVGGFGGDGGNAGGVTSAITGDIVTHGVESYGLLVQSQGGGGGNGGFNVSGNVAASAKGASGNLGIGIGGFGGGGGDGGNVVSTMTGSIYTGYLGDGGQFMFSDYSSGATIQSVGGGGGNGGFNVTGGLSATSDKSVSGNIGIGIGGFGGSGGDGGTVTATQTGGIHTRGIGSYGILVQSAGGGGGSGGFNVTANVAVSKDGPSGNVGIGIGGFGGDGGDGKLVEATMVGDITTEGDGGYGATFQSLGGGGGMGGFNVSGSVSVSLGSGATGSANVGIGGFGGDGGNSGVVIGKLTGDVYTLGNKAHGILVQSLGGGGGNGGLNISNGIAFSRSAAGTINFGLGGFGGEGGNSGAVTGILTGNVTTNGDSSYGAMIQSLGGAGGNGGLNVSSGFGISLSGSSAGSASIGIGGFGGGGGDGKSVEAVVNGNYYTQGTNSIGVAALSLGGGGGAGGLNISSTLGISTGGSGGTASLGLGGFGGDGGSAGSVSLVRIGQTTTLKANSDGVIAASVGGGGGMGGFNISSGISGTNTGKAGSLVIGIGGFGGDGGHGGYVNAIVRDSVWATGSDAPFNLRDIFGGQNELLDLLLAEEKTHWLNGSNGIVVKSQGGGGGSGGFNISSGISIAASKDGTTGGALVFGLGGFGGDGGNASNVDAVIGALSGPRIDVEGRGDLKSAVYIASIGGGGGDGAFNISGGITTDGQVVAGLGGFGGGGGLGRDVTAIVNANLTVTGYKANGLVVQSIGGGGGNGGFNISGGIKPSGRRQPVITFGMGGDGGVGNSAGDVTAQQDGQIYVIGNSSHGVLVQSVAGGGGAGGMDVVGSLNLSGGQSSIDGFAVGIGIGGTGGSGGTAGDVSLRSTGNILVNSVIHSTNGLSILTESEESGSSAGIVVQSIGGGGGVGGFNFTGVVANKGTPVNYAMGGSGGVGGDAGTATVWRGYNADGTVNGSLINTFGKNSAGLVAQSIGGGGGSAGTNLAFTFGKSTPGQTGFGGQFVIGGSGASSGNGQAVKVMHAGTIQTFGEGSSALIAQSIGKGGGNAAVNMGVAKLGATDESTKSVNGISLAVGGEAGNAGSAGDVFVDHDGIIRTGLADSNGIVAQSLAGGGGNVALNMGLLLGADNSMKVGIGRTGGRGGQSGDVTVTTAGEILVNGDRSNGIVAQSIGGAGGLSGSIQAEVQGTRGTGEDKSVNGGGMAIGLEGGAGGHSGTVTVNNAGLIGTAGTEARGILAQSIGGDGGVGGSARTITRGQTDALSLTMGGSGGQGAISEKVTVGNTGQIVTVGYASDGILAQSIGGGGGVGGAASTIKQLSGKSASSVSVTVGGSGGDGAIAGDVEVRNDGTIATVMDKSFGIRAQSIGGGGGVGGATYVVDVESSATNINSANILIGGGGGAGQLAGRVDVFNYGLIQTSGAGSSGISANSIGGGGGDAGSVTNLTVATGSQTGKTQLLGVAIGGRGGSGSIGGTVNVVNASTGAAGSGTIMTTGAEAHGIFAQSLGGGGGNGSSIASWTQGTGTSSRLSLGLNIGGMGGDGNKGGTVTVANDGLIHTTGDKSFGILAQSIGGGGGNGGLVLSANAMVADDAPLLSVGGFGGAGNDGGHVTVTNSGQIFTEGKQADGIVAQSIGGGGGNAGMAIALTSDVKTLVASNLVGILVGALGGGTAGVGGQVDVVNSGDITVLGEGSQAIVAESINGGGGHFSFDVSGIARPSFEGIMPDVNMPDLGAIDGIPNLVKGEPVNKPVNPTIVAARAGASDASQLNAGKVTITNTGTIGAGGNFGAGTTLRSIGGGGGNIALTGILVTADESIRQTYSSQAIYAVGLGSKDSTDSSGLDIASSQSGAILTAGIGTSGLRLQSIGGGGGSALVNLQTEDPTMIDSARLGLGALSTSNSIGGDVVHSQVGAIVTTKDIAHGAVIQSIGGGGGNATAHVGAIESTIPSAKAGISVAGWRVSAFDGPDAIVSLGANGGSANDGGDIDLTFQGGFTTFGSRSNALIVQSIGAGGGEVTLDGLGHATIILGGLGGASGSAGNISVLNDGEVVAWGNSASGVLLQSIGGGGGAVFGDFASADVTLNAGNVGDGGDILFDQDGDIYAVGQQSYGIVAQSLGGGGGFLGGLFAGTAGGVGASGEIDLNVDGSIIAFGLDSTAVLAQSLGSLSAGDISLLSTGDVRGGSGLGIGVNFDGGTNNLIDNRGTMSAVSGLAVKTTSGNDIVENRGIVVGNALMGAGTNLIHNNLGATFITIDTLDLQDGAGSGSFFNEGSLELGLRGPSFPIDLAGGETFAGPVYTDAKTALLYGTSVISLVALDGDYRQSASGEMYYDVAFGPYASDRIDATGDAIVDGTAHINLTWLQDAHPITLIATGGMGIDNGLDAPDTIALDYSILAGPIGIQLAYTSDFGQPFLNHNEQQLGHHMDSALLVGGAAGIGRLMALLGNLTAGQEDVYRAIFDELDPESLLAPTIEHLDAARSFSKELMGCDPAEKKGGMCLWGNVQYHSLKRKRDGDVAYPVKQDGTARLRIGGAITVADGWSLGAAIGYDAMDTLHFNPDDLAGDRAEGNDGEGIHLGVGVKKRFGENDRGSVGLNLAAGWQQVDMSRRQNIFDASIGMADVHTRYIGADFNAGYSFGNGPFYVRPNVDLSAIRLTIDDLSESGLAGLGMRVDEDSHWFLAAEPKLTIGANLESAHMSVTAGALFADRNQFSAPMRFIGADEASDPAIIRTLVDDQSFVVGAEVGTSMGSRLNISFGYQGYFGKRIDSQAARLKLKWSF